MAEGTIVVDTSEYLFGALGNPLTEIAPFQTSPANSHSPVTASGDNSGFTEINERRRPTLFIKVGHENRPSDDNSYLYIRSGGQGSDIDYKGRMRGSQIVTERRALRLVNDNWDFTLGNYTTAIGAGLGLGRYDYRPIRSPDDVSDFLYPDNSYYNGIQLKYRGQATLFYSAKKYASLNKSLYAAAASTIWRDIRFGITSSLTRLSSETTDLSLGSGSVFLLDSNRGIKAEAAYAESGVGIFMGWTRPTLKLRSWHYGKSYLNLQSSGMAYPDYTIYDLSETYGFRQPQAGESGLFLERHQIWGKFAIMGALESWIVSRPSIDGSLSIKYLISGHLSANASFSGRGGVISERNLYETEFVYKGDIELKILSSLWSAGGDIDHHKSLGQAYLLLPLGGSTLAGGRVRLRFDGQTDFFVEEKTMINENLSLKATYRWRQTDGSRLGPLYLIAECVL